MRKALVVVVALAALTLAGCKKQEDTTGGAGVEGDTVKIGLFVSTSGDIATYGVDTRNAAQLAIEEINNEGGVLGKKLEIVFYDAASKAEEAGNAATRLVTRDRVLVGVGAVASSLSLAAAPVFQEQGVPMITPSSTNPAVTANRNWVFRICYMDDFQGGACAVFAFKDLEARRAALLYNRDDAYSSGLAEFFEAKFRSLGGEIATKQEYPRGTADFSTQITNIAGANADVIFCPVYYNDMSLIARQVRGQGLEIPMLGGDGWESEQLVPAAGTALEGSYFGNHYSADDDRAKVQHFVNAYRAKYEKAPTSLAALGYDAMYVVAEAIKKAGEFDRAKIAEALRGVTDYQAVTGTFSIDANRNARKPISILRIEGERFVPVRQIEPEEVE